MNVPTRFVPCATVLLALAASPAIAQDTTSAWDVTLARGETREIDFTTEEGTWDLQKTTPTDAAARRGGS